MLSSRQLDEAQLGGSPTEKGSVESLADRRRSGEKESGFTALRRHEWTVGLGYLILDIATWIVLYAALGYIRQDAFFLTRLQFAVVDLIQVAVIVQALFIIGGYDRRTDMRTLSYTTEHILAVLVAGARSALLIYSAATYDQTMKPSRGVLLLSFAFFLPISLGYRRLFSKFVSASTATRKFVVIGSGREAAEFYRAYKKSASLQRSPNG